MVNFSKVSFRTALITKIVENILFHTFVTLGTNVVSLLWLHWSPVLLCLFFNLAKLQCKQTVVTNFCIGFVNKIHITGKGMIEETWIAKIKEIKCWTEELITPRPFSPISAWS